MIPVIDISEHQGDIDFGLMRSRFAGRVGLIIRSNHTTTVDSRLFRNVWNAVASGWPREDIGFYNFLNPKRSSPANAADVWLATVEAAWGSLDTFLMDDIESYVRESPVIGTSLPATIYRQWLDAFHARLAERAPSLRIIGYSNRAYYDGGVGDRALAARLEWIVARYPVYSDAAALAHPVPHDPSEWEAWATSFGRLPQVPTGAADWAGWQFSAGFNNAGRYFGVSSEDLDLNIVRDEAWDRWTRTGQHPAPAPDIPIPARVKDNAVDIINNSEPRFWAPDNRDYEPGFIKWALEFNPLTGRHEKVHLTGPEYAAAVGGRENGLSNADLDAIPDFLPVVVSGGGSRSFSGIVTLHAD